MTDILTEQQIMDLAVATIKGMDSATKEEIEKIIKWAEESMFNYALLCMIFKGELLPKVDTDGEIVFFKPV